MVKGIDKFREAFKGFSENYVIIGGTACDTVLSRTVMKPRATDDIDMILIVENMTTEFAQAFWNFIKAGGYRSGKRKRGKDKTPVYELYRFEEGDEDYPIKIELLSRHSDLLGEPSGFHIEPVFSNEDISSLSAIMMDEDYYNLTIQNSFIDNEIRFASSIALICLKAKAYLNLLTEREAGKQVNSKDIKKHRNDVLKLVATTAFDDPVPVSEEIFNCIQGYITNIRKILTSQSQSLESALQRPKEDISAYLDILSEAFIVKEVEE